MKFSWNSAYRGVLLAASAALFSCAPEPPGQLMLAVQTDMSLPKDIDTIRIQVATEGVLKFDRDYTSLGSIDGQIRLPGTLALVAPEKADAAVTVTVSAYGGAPRNVRVVRQVVTTVPQDRIAALHLPLRFMCDGFAANDDGEPKSTCPEGQSCVMGECVDREVDSATLPDFEDDDVFSGGSCFDPVVCWQNPEPVELDSSDCSFKPSAHESTLNVALGVEGEGICGPAGCFVTLDAHSDEGWQPREDGSIALSPKVCEKIEKGEIASVVVSSLTSTCPQKSLKLPTCGPWSTAAQSSKPYLGPRALAGGQLRPDSFAILRNRAYFITSKGDETNNALKSVSLEGGKVETISFDSLDLPIFPRSLSATEEKILLTSAPPSGWGQGAIVEIAPGAGPKLLYKELDTPEGIAHHGKKVFWTDYQSGAIFEGTNEGARELHVLPNEHPYRLVADAAHVYVISRGSTSDEGGGLYRIRHHEPDGANDSRVVQLVSGLHDPGALATDLDNDGHAKAVYFTTFSEDGTLERVSFSAGEFQHEVLLEGLKHPNGVAFDGETVLFTSRNEESVRALAKAGSADDPLTVLAKGGRRPGQIAVMNDAIYWMDEGFDWSQPTGLFIKLPKQSAH